MRCKFLLDENELQNSSSIEAAGQVQDNSRLEKANAMIDIMSSALSLVAQINETDRINILKVFLFENLDAFLVRPPLRLCINLFYLFIGSGIGGRGLN